MIGDTFQQIEPEPREVLNVGLHGFFIGVLIGISIGATGVLIWGILL